jgi:hypothetical protein
MGGGGGGNKSKKVRGSERYQLSVGQLIPAYWPVDKDWFEV